MKFHIIFTENGKSKKYLDVDFLSRESAEAELYQLLLPYPLGNFWRAALSVKERE